MHPDFTRAVVRAEAEVCREPHGAKLRTRDLEVIDSELRLLVAIRHMTREAEGRMQIPRG
jgi:hypothetical protein